MRMTHGDAGTYGAECGGRQGHGGRLKKMKKAVMGMILAGGVTVWRDSLCRANMDGRSAGGNSNTGAGQKG